MLFLKDEHIEQYFEYVIKRQTIWHNRFVLKLPKEEWTDDPILKGYKFCNAFRELDIGTQNIIKNVIDREDLTFKQKFLNIICYRFFNTRHYFEDLGVFTEYDKEELKRKAVESKNKRGRLFSNAYLICAHTVDPRQRGKHVQVAEAVQFACDNYSTLYNIIKDETNPEKLLKKIRIIPLVGQFLAYQIALDLIYTGELKFDTNARLLIGIGAVVCLSMLTGKQRVHHNRDYCDKLYEEQWKYTDDIKDIYPSPELLKTPYPEKYEISWNNIQVNLSEFGRYLKLKNGIRGKKKKYY